jgi:hypothetical protein
MARVTSKLQVTVPKAIVLYPTEAVLRTAIRGCATSQLGWFDAHPWAYAEVNQARPCVRDAPRAESVPLIRPRARCAASKERTLERPDVRGSSDVLAPGRPPGDEGVDPARPSAVALGTADDSMTRSACRRRAGGIVRPSARAVLRLTTSSNFVGMLDRELPGLRSPEDAVDVAGSLPGHPYPVDAVRHQAARLHRPGIAEDLGPAVVQRDGAA